MIIYIISAVKMASMWIMMRHSIHALLADGGQSPRGIVPFIRERQHHGQQALGFQGQILISQVII